jgi:hypothetical protein
MPTVPGVKVTMTRAKAEELISALANGRPLTPTGADGWSGDDMLALAGFCMFGAMSQGPAAWNTEEPAFMQTLIGAVLVYRELAQKATDDEFKDAFGDHVVGLARLEGEEPHVEFQILAKGNQH